MSSEDIEAIKKKITDAGYKKVPRADDDLSWRLLFETKVLTAPEIAEIRDAILSSAPTAQQQGK